MSWDTQKDSDRTVLELQGLTKRYGDVWALAGLDLTVREGEVYGFLGRNGAGKSTSIRIIMGISRSTRGAVRLFGKRLRGNPLKARQKIGYVAQEQNFYGWMNPTVMGEFVRGFYPTWDTGEYTRLLGALDLPPSRKIRTFSHGMKAKLALALALAHRPPVLV
ncbi:ATP-binding cassette domain-containing protein, partial [Acidobacteriota bacterium]